MTQPSTDAQLLEAAFEAAPVIGLIVDEQTRLVRANDRARERFPFLEPGLTLLQAFSQHLLAEPTAGAIAEGRSVAFSVRIFSEGWRTYRVTAVPFPEGGGACVYLDDTTEESSYQAMRTQFLANVSHELRTPLTGIAALLETIADPEIDPAIHDRFLSKARQETTRLTSLIADTLFLAEIEAGTGTFEGHCDLAVAAGVVVEALELQSAEHDVALQVEQSEPCPVVLPERLAEMIVTNLVQNALRYAGAGATCVVRCRVANGEVVFEVADDGVGIDEPIWSGSSSASTASIRRAASRALGGTGLGLSIVKHIADRAGGRAEALSRPARGTTIRVTLPLADTGTVAPD